MSSIVAVCPLDGLALPVGRWRVLGRGNLQLTLVVSTDSGLYRCRVRGTSSLSAAAAVTVHGQYTSQWDRSGGGPAGGRPGGGPAVRLVWGRASSGQASSGPVFRKRTLSYK